MPGGMNMSSDPQTGRIAERVDAGARESERTRSTSARAQRPCHAGAGRVGEQKDVRTGAPERCGSSRHRHVPEPRAVTSSAAVRVADRRCGGPRARRRPQRSLSPSSLPSALGRPAPWPRGPGSTASGRICSLLFAYKPSADARGRVGVRAAASLLKINKAVLQRAVAPRRRTSWRDRRRGRPDVPSARHGRGPGRATAATAARPPRARRAPVAWC